MRWELHLHVQQIGPGLQADFLHTPAVEGEPQPQVTTGDKVDLELIPIKVWLEGIVQAASATELIVDFGEERWSLRRPAVVEVTKPGEPTIRTWFFHEKLYSSAVFSP